MADPPPPSSPLKNPRILVALSGGIACYKIASLVSSLVQRGAEVRVIMTESATKFITPLTLQSLTGQPVLTSIWQHDDNPESQHVGLARWCQAFILAPASANTIAKLAHGMSDDLVSLTACALPRDTPKLIAPAMNSDMWQNPIVVRNLETLRDILNYQILGPEIGWQACRTQGPGRMSEPNTIADAVMRLF